MRTTINLDPDVTRAVEEMRRDEGRGVSEAVNALARAGLAKKTARAPYLHRSATIGLTVDVRNVAEVLDNLDGR
jgi:metal-responsive CopG/Arc/MetJ family transcriptional regulator